MENKTGKYLKYAIGEIVLVVIGILIALYINNLNQANQLKTKEQTLLLEIENDLINTQIELESDISDLNSLLKVSDSIIQYLDTINYSQYNKSLFGIKMGWAFKTVKLYPRTIAYENLKSIGAELISNDSIRFYLVDIFDRKLPRVALWEDLATKVSKDSYDELAPIFKSIRAKEQHSYYVLVPEEFDDDSQKLYINRLALLQNDRLLLNSLYKTLLDQIEKLLVLIENEK
ncbi:DUF6090 family protein [Robertkochia solimangrovi]|uniref:DUF6090 family protein n=1 Tax=Robertkochia solimangrovi TaxID=2213046 RepID=UPI00118111A1|nr:DUF6090 family protein [Robertkochia solimangrovi]